MLDQNRVMTALAECHQAMGKYKVAWKLYKKISTEVFASEENGAFENTWYWIFHNAHLQTVHCQVYMENYLGIRIILGQKSIFYPKIHILKVPIFLLNSHF